PFRIRRRAVAGRARRVHHRARLFQRQCHQERDPRSGRVLRRQRQPANRRRTSPARQSQGLNFQGGHFYRYNSGMRMQLAALLACASALSLAADWKPADNPLTTPWTAKVTAEHALPEYPRPQLVRTKWTNLNGLWDYAIRPKGEDRPAQFEGKLLVPNCAGRSVRRQAAGAVCRGIGALRSQAPA